MLKRLIILGLFGTMAICAAAGVLLGMLATDRLTPPQATVQIGPLLVSSIPACDLDRAVRSPCLLPDSDARWLVQLEIQSFAGRQQWALYGGGHASLRLVHR